MCISYKFSNTARNILTHILITVSILFLITGYSSASNEIPGETGSTVLMLDDCDDDNKTRTAPYGDTVSLLKPDGEPVRTLSRDLKIRRSRGGCRAMSVSEDGRFFVVCEDAANRLTMYETATGMKVWSLLGLFNSAVFANGMIYATNGESIFAIDNTGTSPRTVAFPTAKSGSQSFPAKNKATDQSLISSYCGNSVCHSRGSGNPVFSLWTPAFAGVTWRVLAFRNRY